MAITMGVGLISPQIMHTHPSAAIRRIEILARDAILEDVPEHLLQQVLVGVAGGPQQRRHRRNLLHAHPERADPGAEGGAGRGGREIWVRVWLKNLSSSQLFEDN